VRMASTGNTSGHKFLPTTVRLNLGCVRISEIALDALQIRGLSTEPVHELNQTVNLDMVNIKLTGDNLLFKSMSNSVVSGDIVDTAVFANVLTCLPVDNSIYEKVIFDTDKPTCDVVPPTDLKQIKVEISKVNGTDEIEIGSCNASVHMVFSLYSEDIVSL